MAVEFALEFIRMLSYLAAGGVVISAIGGAGGWLVERFG